MTRYDQYREEARMLVKKRLEFFNQQYGFTYGKIFIRNQKTRWGSCSSSGNLNFNYKIVFLPPELADYIVIHELCHLSQFNHSDKFWNLVEQTCPDYKLRIEELKKVKMPVYRRNSKYKKKYIKISLRKILKKIYS